MFYTFDKINGGGGLFVFGSLFFRLFLYIRRGLDGFRGLRCGRRLTLDGVARH